MINPTTLRDEKDEKERKTIRLMIIVAIIMMLMANVLILKSKDETDSLSKQVIRFHVVANSDTTEDQLLKQQVKDEVVEYMEPLIKDCTCIGETRYVIHEELPQIENIAKDVIAEYGKDYKVYVAIDRANFPTKAYGDIVLPAGEYEACRIVIGEGKGENWWCVMYPPLCYIDAASGVVPLEGKEQLQQELTERQYKLIVANNQEKRYQVKFKIVDTINSIFCKDNYKTKR